MKNHSFIPFFQPFFRRFGVFDRRILRPGGQVEEEEEGQQQQQQQQRQ